MLERCAKSNAMLKNRSQKEYSTVIQVRLYKPAEFKKRFYQQIEYDGGISCEFIG